MDCSNVNRLQLIFFFHRSVTSWGIRRVHPTCKTGIHARHMAQMPIVSGKNAQATESQENRHAGHVVGFLNPSIVG
jgi:hypothetical protein